MGKRWRKYAVGKYRLGQLHGEAVVCWRDEKGPHRRRLGVNTEIEGRAALDSWVRSVTLLRERQTKTVQDIFDAYRADREKDGKLIANFDNDWKALKPRFGDMEVDAITDDVCRDYAAMRFEGGKSASTIWTELTRLRSCINWALKRRIISTAPYIWVPSKPEGRTTTMTADEVLSLIDACVMPHLKLFVILAITTGARSAAICQLEWTRVDFESGMIDYRRKEAVNPLTKRTMKGRAVVALTAEARAALIEAKTGALTGHVIEWDGLPVKKIRKAFAAAVKRAGLPKTITPHVLRHTVATWLDEDGIPMERISKMLGHRDRRTTEKIYSKPGVDVLRPAADVIDLRLKRKKVAD
jgi:integrase